MTGRETSSGSNTHARTESMTRSMMVSMPNSSVLSWAAISCSCRFFCASCSRSCWESFIPILSSQQRLQRHAVGAALGAAALDVLTGATTTMRIGAHLEHQRHRLFQAAQGLDPPLLEGAGTELCTHCGFRKAKAPARWLRGFASPPRSEAVSVNRHGSAGAREPCSVDRRNEQGGHKRDLRHAGAVVGAFCRARMMRTSTRARKPDGASALWQANGVHGRSSPFRASSRRPCDVRSTLEIHCASRGRMATIDRLASQ